MKVLQTLIQRNLKMFFKDKGIFLTSLITPVILLVLYAVFLGDVYKDSFIMILNGAEIEEKLIDGCVGGQLISSILSVSCVTVAFCSNMIMVQDKANGTIYDLCISPVKPSTLALSYYIASFCATLIVCYAASAVCMAYMAVVGWYMSVLDVFALLTDVLLIVMMATALSSIVNFFLSSQGQISAVGTLVSSGYGFISGAYMPLASFGVGLQRVLSFLPSTYATALLKNHALGGVYRAMSRAGLSEELLRNMKDNVDCSNVYFFGNLVSLPVMYLILLGAIVLFLGVYIALHSLSKKQK